MFLLVFACCAVYLYAFHLRCANNFISLCRCWGEIRQ
uniref:Uncharacterized protein n=1 Tax=virus sp. ctLpa4 TaxID=2825814 RepID=A0A8S5RLH1_9VIRU|nr:MAG TPA: hypothetical protein [virus sp. ctLpa4]